MDNKNQIVIDMFKNQFSDSPRAYNTNDFSQEVLNQLRQNIYNQEYDLKNRVSEILANAEWRKKYNRQKDYDPMLRREFSYRNYGSGDYLDPFEMNAIQLAQKVYGNYDPKFVTQTTVGSGRYTIDPNGNVTVTDTYDFDKAKGMQSLLANILHKGGSTWGKPYPVNIDLGNIKDWNLQYTGNRDLDQYYNRYNRFIGK